MLHLLSLTLLVGVGYAASEGILALAGPPLYWCPDKSPDRRYSATPDPGCKPLVDMEERKKKAEEKNSKIKSSEKKPATKVENLQVEISDFIREYRRFVECCATNPESLEELDSLDERAEDLLEAAQSGLFSEQMKVQSVIAGQMLQPVAQARDDLRKLKTRLKMLSDAQDRLPTLDFESKGRERRRIQEEEESLRKDFRPTLPPESARTGTEIGDTTTPNRPGTLSQDTSVPNTTGTDFGNTTLRNSTGMDVGTTPPTGGDIGQVPPTGPDIGTTGRVGPSVGDSSLNERR